MNQQEKLEPVLSKKTLSPTRKLMKARLRRYRKNTPDLTQRSTEAMKQQCKIDIYCLLQQIAQEEPTTKIRIIELFNADITQVPHTSNQGRTYIRNMHTADISDVLR
jgi:hypothetical protein